MRSPEDVLIRPLLTEKILELGEKQNKYGFEVPLAANKHEIKYAVEKKFDVRVTAVNVINVKGKHKRLSTRRGMTSGKRRSYKKAIVTVADDKKLDFFSGTTS